MLGFSNLLTIAPEAKLGMFVAVNRDTEAGGGSLRMDRRITDLVLEQLAASARNAVPALQFADTAADYSAFSGNYHFGVYCRTCTAAERARGAWSRASRRWSSPRSAAPRSTRTTIWQPPKRASFCGRIATEMPASEGTGRAGSLISASATPRTLSNAPNSRLRNASSSICERKSGRSVYKAFNDDVAEPIGLQDWRCDLPVRYVTLHLSFADPHGCRDLA